jgi:hypothetical protein
MPLLRIKIMNLKGGFSMNLELVWW